MKGQDDRPWLRPWRLGLPYLPAASVFLGGVSFAAGVIGNLWGGLSSWVLIGGAAGFGVFALLGLVLLVANVKAPDPKLVSLSPGFTAALLWEDVCLRLARFWLRRAEAAKARRMGQHTHDVAHHDGECPGGPHRFIAMGGDGREYIGTRLVGRFEIQQCEKCRETRWVDLV